jgi:hypothetical protein
MAPDDRIRRRHGPLGYGLPAICHRRSHFVQANEFDLAVAFGADASRVSSSTMMSSDWLNA